MGIFNRALQRLRRGAAGGEQRSIYLTDSDYAGGLWLMGAYGSNDADVSVTPDNALTAASVFACVTLIANDIATLPVQVIDLDTRTKVRGHPVAQLMRNPNEYMTPVSFWIAYLLNNLLYGNGYAASEWRGATPIAMLPLMARTTEPRRRGGQLFYVTRVGSMTTTLRPDQVLHTPFMAVDGICGISPIATSAQAIGTDMALEKFAAKFFSNGANIGTVIELPPMAPNALQDFKRQWNEQYVGLKNAHRIAAAPGLKVHKSGVSPRDAQAVEAQDHQLRKVARIYRVPIGKLDAEKSTYSNLEAQDRNYAQSCLRPWVVAIEQEFSRKLLRTDEQDRYKIEFNLDAIVRASLADRMAADAQGVQAGIITPNEARDHHNLPPVDGGDKLLSPLNMTPASSRSAPIVLLDHRSQPAGANGDQVKPLIESIAGAIATKEANAARRAAKKPEEFAVWAKEFFTEHRAHLVERLPGVPAATLDQLADQARDQFIAAAGLGELEQLLEKWPDQRRSVLVDGAIAALQVQS